MANKSSKPHSEVRQRHGRVGIRIHEDLREALEILAKAENRALSNYVETILVNDIATKMMNGVTPEGKRVDDKPWMPRSALYRQPSPPKKR